jgi:DNA-binding Lrp family transcriptional regulator
MQRLRPLDHTDHEIVACLRENARRSYASVGSAVGLSAAAVKRRVDRLEQDGVITGYSARTDPRAFGEDFEALVEIYCSDRTAPADVAKSLAGLTEIRTAFTVSGEPDAIARIRVESIAHLEKVVERLRRDPNVVRTRTMIVLSTIVDRPA